MFGMDSYNDRSSSTSNTNSDGQSNSGFSDNLSLYSGSSDIWPTYINDNYVQTLDAVDDRNNLAEVMLFKNTSALCKDLRLITEMPEMCDVEFLVGEDKVPVYGVKAILSTRSIAFFGMILSQEQMVNLKFKTQLKKKCSLFSKLRKLPNRCKKLNSSPSDKRPSGHLTIDIMNFDPDTFRRVIIYIHSGHVSVNVHSVIGLMNAADTYGLADLRSACFQFACECINLGTILQLFTAARSYSTFKWTQSIVTKIFDFIDENADRILYLSSFENVSKEIAILILARSELRVTEETKWDAALNWSRRHTGAENSQTLIDILRFFTPRINFCKIPVSKLTEEIRPLVALSNDVTDQAIEINPGPQNEQMSSASVNTCLTRPYSIESFTSIISSESLAAGCMSHRCPSADSGFSLCSSENSSLLSNIW